MKLVSLLIYIAVVVTTAFTLLLIPGSSSRSSSILVDALDVTPTSDYTLTNANEAELRIFSPGPITVTIGPNVVLGYLYVSIAQGTTLIFDGVTVNGDSLFVGLGTGATLDVTNSNFNGRVQIGAASSATRVRFNTNTFTITSTTSINSLLQFQSSSSATSFEFTSNTMSITSSTSSGFVSCIHFSPSLLSGTTLTITDNQCSVTAPIAAGIFAEAGVDFSGSVTVARNTITASSSSVSACFRIQDFRSATLDGAVFDSNTCTASASSDAEGLTLETLQSSVSADIINITGNSFTVSSSGGTSTATAIVVKIPIASSLVALVRTNTISVSAGQGTAGISFESDIATNASIDIVSNDITVNNGGSSSSLDTGALRILQSSAVQNVKMTLWKNTFTLQGSHQSGYIAIANGVSITGSWLLSGNTLTDSLSPLLFSPQLNLNGGQGNVIEQCNTRKGSAMALSYVTSALTNVGSLTPTVLACGVCTWSLVCDTARTIESISSGGECFCRCRNYRTRFDPLPRGTQCLGAAGRVRTASRTLTKTVTSLTRSRSVSKGPTLVEPNVVTDSPSNTTAPVDPELSDGAIAGIVIGGIALLILLALLIWCCCCRDKACCPCCPCCKDEDGKKKDRGLSGGDDDDSSSDEMDGGMPGEDEPAPVDPCTLPVVKTATDIIAEREDVAQRHYDELSGLDVEGDLAPSRPANPYAILSLPMSTEEEEDEENGQSPLTSAARNRDHFIMPDLQPMTPPSSE